MDRAKLKPVQTAAKNPVRLRQVLILLAIALAVRFLYLQQIAANPYFHNPIIDAQTYDEMAVAIAAG